MIIELSYVEDGLEEGIQLAWRRPLPGYWRDTSEGQTRQMDDSLLLLVKRTGR